MRAASIAGIGGADVSVDGGAVFAAAAAAVAVLPLLLLLLLLAVCSDERIGKSIIDNVAAAFLRSIAGGFIHNIGDVADGTGAVDAAAVVAVISIISSSL